MADDTFELLTKMYADFTSQFKEMQKRMSSVEGKVTSLEGDVSSLKGLFGKLQLKFENDIDRKIDLLLETRHEVNNRLDVIENKIDILTSKVDRHDIEIKVIKAAN